MTTPAPALTLAVRLGCQLTYEVTQRATLLVNFRPPHSPVQQITEEKIAFGNNLPNEEFTDEHGNLLHRLVLPAGTHTLRHDAIVRVSELPDNHDVGQDDPVPAAELPPEVLRYTLPSRYCDSDKLLDFAWEKFGAIPLGHPRVRAICDWLHHHIEYRFGSGRPDLSANDVIQRGYGVCRDFAHMGIALCRTFNLPARYVVGHLPDIGFEDPGTPMDFHAYFEVYLGGKWFTYDARFNVPRIGRVKICSGYDAVNGAFSTIYGAAKLTQFDVWAYQVRPGAVSVNDPIDLSQRLDGTVELRR